MFTTTTANQLHTLEILRDALEGALCALLEQDVSVDVHIHTEQPGDTRPLVDAATCELGWKRAISDDGLTAFTHSLNWRTSIYEDLPADGEQPPAQPWPEVAEFGAAFERVAAHTAAPDAHLEAAYEDRTALEPDEFPF